MSDETTGVGNIAYPLEGTLWHLQAIGSAGGSVERVPDEVLVTARFEAGRVSGSGGCNHYFGPCSIAGGTLTLGPIGSTRRACPDPAGAVEDRFLAALGSVTGWTIVEGQLVLRDASGGGVLAFLPAVEPPLVGTEWHATGINNGRGAVAGLVDGSSVTALFGEDGAVAGSGGCNRYRGDFAADDGRIRVGELATTLMACERPIMDQEAAYLAALRRATLYRVDGPTLELRADDGSLQVSFTAQDPDLVIPRAGDRRPAGA